MYKVHVFLGFYIFKQRQRFDLREPQVVPGIVDGRRIVV